MSIKVFNIQRFSLHDGPGIRTTVFLKGCSLKCPWCCNPESIDYNDKFFFDKKRCLKKDGYCLVHENCSYVLGKIDKSFFEKNICPAVKKIVTEYSPTELFEIIMKDKNFFGKSGGVTFSGGEALLQYKELLPLLQRISNKKVHISFETSLGVPLINIKSIYKYIDLLYIDFKTADYSKAKDVLGLDLNIYKKNLEFLFKHFPKNKIVIRIPVVSGFNNNERSLLSIANFLSNFDVRQIELFSVHNLAASKYEMLGKTYKRFVFVSLDDLQKNKAILQKVCANVQIIQI